MLICASSKLRALGQSYLRSQDPIVNNNVLLYSPFMAQSRYNFMSLWTSHAHASHVTDVSWLAGVWRPAPHIEPKLIHEDARRVRRHGSLIDTDNVSRGGKVRHRVDFGSALRIRKMLK